MKKFNLFLAGVFASLLITVAAFAHLAPSFYAGKWDVLVKGTPQGDAHIMFTIVDTDGKLSGTYTDPESKKEVPLTSVSEKDGKFTTEFTIMTYDVNLALEKVDETHVKGSMMGMFEATGERLKADGTK